MSYTSIGAVETALGYQLQIQLNRVAYAMKWPQIKVDGDVGKNTVELANRFAQLGSSWITFTKDSLIGATSEVTSKAREFADRKGVPATLPVVAPPAPGGKSPVPTTPGAPPGTPPPPGGGVMAWLGNLSMVGKVALGVGGVMALVAVGVLNPGGKRRGKGRR